MKVLAIRYCTVSKSAAGLADVLTRLGIPERKFDGLPPPPPGETFSGAIFPAGDSWVEIWPPGPGMPEGTMLQLVVDDADAFAQQAKKNGLAPEGPMDAHGERIYFLKTPDGSQMSFQSALAVAA